MREKIVNYILIPFIGFIILSWNKLLTCQQFVSLSFDDQSFLNWDYAKSINLTPYKDFNYPYGLISYLKIDDVFWYFSFLFLAFIICIFIYKILINVSESKVFGIFAFFTYCLFIGLFIDLDTFVRYGSVFPIIYIYSYFVHKKKFFTYKNALISGIIFGLFYVFMIDMLIYISVLFFAFTIINLIFIKDNSKNKLFYKFFMFLLTFFIVILFLTLIGINQLGINELREYVYYLSEISNFAKVPFPPSLRSPEGLFNLGIIIISLIYIFNMKIKNQSYFILIGLIIIFIVFQQKSIIRAIHHQLSIYGFIIYLILLNELFFRIKKKNIKIYYSFLYIFLLTLIVFFFVGMERASDRKEQATFSINEKCIENRIGKFESSDLKPYLNVKSNLGNSLIFSFPGDPIFYALFEQRPPHYSSAYEASPVFSQIKQINYIVNNDVKFVIINKNITHSQDGVPDKIRNKLVFNYIINNFEEYMLIDNFLILKKR